MMNWTPDTNALNLVRQALLEDIGPGDITANLLDQEESIKARIMTREPMVLCGLALLPPLVDYFTCPIQWHSDYQDGDQLAAGDTVLMLEGRAKELLTLERTLLNFIQTLSGTASCTAKYVRVLNSFGVRLLDTRKTLPGWRSLQKYAVRCGGGMNHRLGLYDAYLIKENHIEACGSIVKAVSKARQQSTCLLEVEVENLKELVEAIDAGVDRVMLDNFNLLDIQAAVEQAKGRVELEVSGNVTLERLPELAKTGIDFISVGAITKHIEAIDLSMRLV